MDTLRGGSTDYVNSNSGIWRHYMYMYTWKILSICSEVIQVDKKEDRDRIFPNLLVPSHKTWIRFDESKISLFIHLLLSLGKGNIYRILMHFLFREYFYFEWVSEKKSISIMLWITSNSLYSISNNNESDVKLYLASARL